MIGLDGALLVVAYATAITASLQAGSRAKYLLENNEIGIKEGPLILPPKGNETSPLWDLVQAFQQSVELGLLYRLDKEKYDFLWQPSSGKLNMEEHKIEPYSLSPFPKSTTNSDQLDQLVDMYIEDTIKSQDSSSIIPKSLKRLVDVPSKSIAKFSHSTKYWMKRAWHWRAGSGEFDQEEADDGGRK